jgi:perosamine synthetase
VLKILPQTDGAGSELDVVLAAAGRHQGANFPAMFSAALAAAAGFRHGLVVSSDSAAVSTLIGAMGLRTGDQVLVAAHLRARFVFALLFEGLVPIFIDCLRPDLTLDETAIAVAVTGATRAAFLAAPWGVAQDLLPIRAALATHGCGLVLDVTDCLSPELELSGLAAAVDVALISLTEGDGPLSTGEGGALLSNDATLMAAALTYQRFSDLAGELPGINQKISAMQAALGLYRLDRLQLALFDAGFLGAALRTAGTTDVQETAFGTHLVLRHAGELPGISLRRLPQSHRLASVAGLARPCPRLDMLAASLCAVPLFATEPRNV